MVFVITGEKIDLELVLAELETWYYGFLHSSV